MTMAPPPSSPLLFSSVTETPWIEALLPANHRILERLVSPHPLESLASIATVLSEVRTASTTRTVVSVYGGPDCGQDPQLHASFTLQAEANAEAPRKRLCWCSFPHTQHLLLAVLVNNATVAIYDVYPDNNDPPNTDNSWTFSLPFDCDAIQALPKIAAGPNSSGLLLQRKPDPGDQQDDDSQFILKSPPKIWSQPREEPVMQVPSLFSLHHPLEDVLPVALDSLSTSGISVFQPRLVTDPFEQLIWTGTAHWNQEQNEQVLAVTYHSVWKRHAVWAVTTAPPPPPAVPLYQQTAKLMMANSNRQALQDAFLFPQDLATDEFSEMPPSSHAAQTSRQEALADALGVKRTPRLSVEPPSSISNLRSRQQRSSTHPEGISPRSEQLDNSHASWSTTSQPIQQQAVTTSASIVHDSQGPFAAIHSKMALEMIYAETNNASQQAMRVFLASNETASGKLTLCLLTPKMNSTNDHSQLVLLDLRPTEKQKLIVSRPGNGKPVHLECISAQPLAVAPVPCHSIKRRGTLATDILLLTKDHRLELCRASHAIIDCATTVVDGNTGLLPVDVVDAVANRVSVTWRLRERDATVLRMRLTLKSSSPLAEKVLSALDVTFEQEPWISQWPLIVLKIRADVCRLEQRLSDKLFLSSDYGWASCATVLLSLVQIDLFGCGSLLERLPDATTETGSAWDLLVNAGSRASYDDIEAMLAVAARELETTGSQAALYLGGLKQNAGLTRCFFDSLHFIHEECHLSTSSSAFVPKVASVMLYLCSFCSPRDERRKAFYSYYAQAVEGESAGRFCFSLSHERQSSMDQITSFGRPLCFLSCVCDKLEGRDGNSSIHGLDYNSINSSCFKMRAIVRILSSLFDARRPTTGDLDVVSTLCEEGLLSSDLVREELPLGIALPCLEVLYRCRNDPALADLPGWSKDAYNLVGRDDIVRHITAAQNGVDDSAIYALNGVGAQDDRFADIDGDGLVPLERSSALLFDDNRVHEAARLLRSSRPIFLRVLRTVETSDHDYERLKQKKLALLARRALALPVGRGMLAFGNMHPVAAEPLPIPELCLKGRVPPANTSLALDEAECPVDMRVWPEFHNGVAAGVRLTSSEESATKVSRTWIIYNRPATAVQSQDGDEAGQQAQRKLHAHGGFLLGLGLRGHLSALEMSDVYDYLTKGVVTITVGILLGLAANKRKSCDIAVSKMLCLHIPSLIPNHFSAIDVASTVQAAAVTGTGLLFLQSSNRMITEFLLNEIGKRPEADTTVFDREAYTLACGIALGMVNLRVGDKATSDHRAQGLADLRLEERLNTYLKGGIDADERKRNRETSDRFSAPSAGMNGDERCSTVFESDQINIDVTAPAATLALALMYVKTGNETIASMLSLPDTHFMLESIRPDFLALRVVARTLILWDKVDPSDWIAKEMPAVVSGAYSEIRDHARQLMEDVSVVDAPAKRERLVDYDRRAVRQIYVHIVAGACFGLGLRFAGTGDERAKAVILKRVLELQALRESNDLVSVASRPEFSILDTCLGCTAISLAMVLAGTGDLDALRLFKVLRWRCEEDTTYGHHMTYGIAIGLLFLGGGACTLGREPDDIAALLAAFFPRFPVGTADNQYHLQACRHLYALAVKRKELRAVDVDTNELVSLPVELRFVGAPSVRATVPCLLRNSDCPATDLVVLSDEHYPLTINLRNVKQSLTFFVKKKTCQSEEAMSPFLQSVGDYLDARKDGFLSLALEDCSKKGTIDALGLYLAPLFGSSLRRFWDLKLYRAYYNGIKKAAQQSILDTELLLPYMLEKTERSLAKAPNQADVRCYFPILYGDYEMK